MTKIVCGKPVVFTEYFVGEEIPGKEKPARRTQNFMTKADADAQLARMLRRNPDAPYSVFMDID